jgi:hypothetical protein
VFADDRADDEADAEGQGAGDAQCRRHRILSLRTARGEWDTLIASAASLPGGEAQALEDSIAASFMAGAPRPRK